MQQQKTGFHWIGSVGLVFGSRQVLPFWVCSCSAVTGNAVSLASVMGTVVIAATASAWTAARVDISAHGYFVGIAETFINGAHFGSSAVLMLAMVVMVKRVELIQTGHRVWLVRPRVQNRRWALQLRPCRGVLVIEARIVAATTVERADRLWVQWSVAVFQSLFRAEE